MSLHKHQRVDWQYMMDKDVMSDLVPRFNQIGLFHFLANRVDYNEMIIRRFYATVEVDMEKKMFEWITGKKRYQATFQEFAEANKLDYEQISHGANIVHEDNFGEIAQYYEPARLNIPRVFV